MYAMNAFPCGPSPTPKVFSTLRYTPSESLSKYREACLLTFSPAAVHTHQAQAAQLDSPHEAETQRAFLGPQAAGKEAYLVAVIQLRPEEEKASYSVAETAYLVVATAYALEDLEDEVGAHHSYQKVVVACRLGMGKVVEHQSRQGLVQPSVSVA